MELRIYSRHYWLNAMTRYGSEFYKQLFEHHAAYGGRLAKKELTAAEYKAFRRAFDGSKGLTAFGYPQVLCFLIWLQNEEMFTASRRRATVGNRGSPAGATDHPNGKS